MAKEQPENHILLISCDDEKGLISKLTAVLLKHNLNITVMREFVEERTNQFFARLEVFGYLNMDQVLPDIQQKLPSDARVEINPKKKKDVVILATKEHHCLGDLLIKNQFGELHANIKCVIANHDVLRPLVEKFDVPFFLISHENKTKKGFENEILARLAGYQPDYIVLSKFMRILSPEFVSQYEHRIINIHHSFLPAFMGANPYRQAFERGVKMIGATAHIVNHSLDEGPIITQRTVSVNHTYSVRDMVLAGREIEKAVLSDALKKVFEDRVFVSGNKTIILE